MVKNHKTKYNGNGMDNPSIYKNPLFIAFKKAGVDDITAVDAALSATLLGSNIATKEDLANHPTKEDMKQYPTKEDLQNALANHPTKEDLQNALANHPTKEDMKQYATKEDLNNALANYATKVDMHEAINRQTKWIVGTVIAVGIMVVGLLM